MSVEYERPKDPTDYRFSPSETKLLTLLPQDGTKINTLELTKKFYSDRKTLPEYARIAIGGLIRALVDKTYDFKRGFRVMRSERQGPKPILIWMEVLPSRVKAKSVQAKPAIKSAEAKPAQAKPTKPTSKPEEVGKEAKPRARSLDRGKPKILDKPKARQEARRVARRSGFNGAAKA
jgi:hypothetical protein